MRSFGLMGFMPRTMSKNTAHVVAFHWMACGLLPQGLRAGMMDALGPRSQQWGAGKVAYDGQFRSSTLGCGMGSAHAVKGWSVGNTGWGLRGWGHGWGAMVVIGAYRGGVQGRRGNLAGRKVGCMQLHGCAVGAWWDHDVRDARVVRWQPGGSAERVAAQQCRLIDVTMLYC